MNKNCPKCSEEILDSAKKCKHCSADLRNWFVKHPIWSVVIGFVALGIFGATIDPVEDNNVDTNVEIEDTIEEKVEVNNVAVEVEESEEDKYTNWMSKESNSAEFSDLMGKVGSSISEGKLIIALDSMKKAKELLVSEKASIPVYNGDNENLKKAEETYRKSVDKLLLGIDTAIGPLENTIDGNELTIEEDSRLMLEGTASIAEGNEEMGKATQYMELYFSN